MMRRGGPGDGTPSLESLRELRLRALLNDLVHDLGLVKAAEQLGIDRKTLWRSEGAGEMSLRLTEALERLLLERAVAAVKEDRGRVGALEDRGSDLERQLASVRAATGGSKGNGGAVENAVIDALRQEFAQEIQRLERRLVRPEAPRGTAPVTPAGGSRAVPARSRRRYPDVVAWHPPMTMRRCTARPGRWWASGAGCGPGTRPRAGAWPGCRVGNGFLNWKWRCWRSTG